MAGKVKTIPDGFRTLTPYLVVRNAAKAIEFYKKAFAAEARSVHYSLDGKIMNADLRIGDSAFLLSDEFPGAQCRSPQSIRGTSVTIHIYVEDVDGWFNRAVSAGATILMPVMDMFWGDRYGQLKDPFGHHWSLATHKEDPTPEEIERRAKEVFAKMASQGQHQA